MSSDEIVFKQLRGSDLRKGDSIMIFWDDNAKVSDGRFKVLAVEDDGKNVKIMNNEWKVAPDFLTTRNSGYLGLNGKKIYILKLSKTQIKKFSKQERESTKLVKRYKRILLNGGVEE